MYGAIAKVWKSPVNETVFSKVLKLSEFSMGTYLALR
jgi:hypothetical protein